MTPASFETIVAGLGAIFDLQEPGRICAGESFSYGDVLFKLLYFKEGTPDRFYLVADFGSLPSAAPEQAMERLLIENHLSFTGAGPGFCISPHSGHVIYTIHLTLRTTTPRDLAARMTHIAQKANQWRDDYFLSKPIGSATGQPLGSRRRIFPG